MNIASNDINSYYRSVLDALPLAVFVVDEDVRIQDFNRAAVELFYIKKTKFLNERGGDILQCIHSNDSPDGCGKGPLCSSCIIRGSVERSLNGKTVTHERGRFSVVWGEKEKEMDILISASPIEITDKRLVVLTFEGIADL